MILKVKIERRQFGAFREVRSLGFSLAFGRGNRHSGVSVGRRIAGKKELEQESS